MILLTFQVELVEIIVDPAPGEKSEVIVWVSPLITEASATELFEQSFIAKSYELRMYYRGTLVGQRPKEAAMEGEDE